ncbi:hypothetical protein T492DRAFT_106258 [Pavlovales sp. CCMP2436]|nr:hypothetical protein T492DRAFT_106258 [Pavlovales sp. CCMP2436]
MAMEVRRVIPDAHTSAILSVAYNHHRREYVTGGQDGAIKMWEHDTGKHLRTLVDGHLGWVMGLRYAGPLRMLFSTSIDSYLMVWDTRAKCEWFQRIKMEAQGHCIEYDERRALV